MSNVIQGTNAVLSFDKNGWAPWLCASDISISLNTDIISVRTVKGGHWAKNAMQKLSYSITISGVLVMNSIGDANWSGFDMVDNWLNFADCPFRIAYTADDSTIKSLQGSALISGITFGASATDIVKNDINLTGNGELKFFDGLIPCPSTITSITITGQTSSDGVVHIGYTYTGALYQVKYKIDGVGDWVYALKDVDIVIPGMNNGNHFVDMVPVCVNGYESENTTSQSFVVTRALVCTSAITDITISGGSATPVFTGTAPGYYYNIDSGLNYYLPLYPTPTPIPIGSLSTGPHTIIAQPWCANSVGGTGFVKTFTVASQPAQSQVSYTFSSWKAGNSLQIYVNGVLNISPAIGSSGSIIVPTGSTVKAEMTVYNDSGSNMQLRVLDTTISSTLSNQVGTAPDVYNYSFTANGDSYAVQAFITP